MLYRPRVPPLVNDAEHEFAECSQAEYEFQVTRRILAEERERVVTIRNDFRVKGRPEDRPENELERIVGHFLCDIYRLLCRNEFRPSLRFLLTALDDHRNQFMQIPSCKRGCHHCSRSAPGGPVADNQPVPQQQLDPLEARALYIFAVVRHQYATNIFRVIEKKSLPAIGCRYSHDIAVRTLQFLEASECLRVSAERNGSIGSRGTPENCERIGHE